MKSRTLLLTIAFAIAAAFSFAQTADEIVNKHFEALGGKDKFANLKTMKIVSSVEIAPGMKAPITMYIVNNQSVRMEIEVQGMKIVSAADGDSGWAINPMSGKKEAERMNSDDIRQSKHQMDIAGPMFDYKAKGNTIELLGKEDMEGTEVYKLKVVKKNGDIQYEYIDAETFLLLKETTTFKFTDKEITSDVIYSDYRKVNDIMFPFSIENRQAGAAQGQALIVESVEINPVIDSSLFTLPAPVAEGSVK